MKGTKFSEPFMEDIDFWERGLSMVLEVLEQMLNVQRQWMYLGGFLGFCLSLTHNTRKDY